jgi:uncharacterized membrane protein
MNLEPKIMKTNIWKIVYLVVCIIVFIIAINNISKCSKEISEENNEQTITANAREQYNPKDLKKQVLYAVKEGGKTVYKTKI